VEKIKKQKKKIPGLTEEGEEGSLVGEKKGRQKPNTKRN